MRNAAANYDDDFASSAPPRKTPAKRAPSAKAGTTSKRKKGKRRLGFAIDMHRVARWGAIGISVTVALGIMVNALMMQKGRHPAPLFGQSIALGQAAHPAAPVAPAKPEVKAAVAAPEPADISPPPPAARDEAAPADGDAIARLLQGGTPAGDRPEAKTVSGAQRALTKLGFNVKSTGTLGPQTKKAIEAFEKDRHLPVHGELSRRLVKILAAESGMRIDR